MSLLFRQESRRDACCFMSLHSSYEANPCSKRSRSKEVLQFIASKYLLTVPGIKILLSSKYRFTIDEKEDFILLKKIIKQFPKILKNTYVSSNKFIDFVKNRKNIYKINSHIIRNAGLLKSLKKEQKIN